METVAPNTGKVPQPGKDFADEEVNLKDIFYKAIDFFWEVVRMWWLILIVGALMAAYNYYKATKVVPTYRAATTFMVSDKKEEIRYSDYASLDYGISERASIIYNLDKVVQLSESMRVVRQALFYEYTYQDTLDYLANHMIRIYNLHNKWNGPLKNFYFEHDRIPNFNRIENNALKNLYFLVTGRQGEKRLTQVAFDLDSGILSIVVNSTSEFLSIALSTSIYRSLSEFYIESESAKQRKIYQMVIQETDSLRGEIVAAQRRLLAFQDRHLGLSQQQYAARKKGLEEEVFKLGMAFGSSYEDMQSTEMALLNTIPFIQLIDEPLTPIRPAKPSPIRTGISSFILWCFLTVIFVVIRRVILDILNKDKGPHAMFEAVQNGVENSVINTTTST